MHLWSKLLAHHDLVLSIANAGAATASAVAAFLAWQVSRESARTAAHSVAIQNSSERAYLELCVVSITPLGADNYNVQWQFRNHGRTIGFPKLYELKFRAVSADKGFPSLSELKVPWAGALAPIPAGEAGPVFDLYLQNPSPAVRVDLRENRAFLFLFGRVMYTDINEQEHISTFGMRYFGIVDVARARVGSPQQALPGRFHPFGPEKFHART